MNKPMLEIKDKNLGATSCVNITHHGSLLVEFLKIALGIKEALSMGDSGSR